MTTTTTTTTSIDKDFTFAKKQEKGRLHTSKVCKAAKEYKGGCEHCSSDIHKGTFVLTADEVVTNSNGFGVRTVKTHRLCASCTADYIKATSVQTPEPTYAERQAQWVKENNVKEGTKVRVTRTFTEDEDGSRCRAHDDLVGMTGSVGEYGVLSFNLGVTMSDGNVRGIPYFALEVIKEPTYRPFTSDELNDLVGKIVARKCDGNKMLVNERCNPIKVGLGNGCAYTADELLSLFTLDGEPCGMKERVCSTQ